MQSLTLALNTSAHDKFWRETDWRPITHRVIKSRTLLVCQSLHMTCSFSWRRGVCRMNIRFTLFGFSCCHGDFLLFCVNTWYWMSCLAAWGKCDWCKMLVSVYANRHWISRRIYAGDVDTMVVQFTQHFLCSLCCVNIFLDYARILGNMKSFSPTDWATTAMLVGFNNQTNTSRCVQIRKINESMIRIFLSLTLWSEFVYNLNVGILLILTEHHF